ncbi:ATP-binding protein [Zoogloea sp.]|uniref:hybrid sensor histidine kinase/response regulator n=1 Tax=Zoogloea sp. TaxID=49181 RepID=UPI0035B3B228
MSSALPPSGFPPEAVQRVVKVRRDYNRWVARETMEDYALRFTARSHRRWSEFQVANTAFGVASFLVLEAVGATLLVEYGFANALWAILATGLIIFLAGLPISIYAARYGVDMDLLTRGAGFGYIGSTLTSLIYASFTFIFFALEAAIMAYALELAFDIPPAWGYLLCAMVVIPLVTHGVTAITRLQALTQPLWLVMLGLPFVFVLHARPGLLQDMAGYGGIHDLGPAFNMQAFGAALTVGIALITQMGEQADYLRFLPEPRPGQERRWWTAVLVGGPGWVLLGVVKMLGGALLAYLAISNAVPVLRAVDPNQMYLAAYEYVFPSQPWAVGATALFVVVSQLKINVTNAYAGSLAWSNFFARLTHSHPGRVVWMVFNTLIALMLMELDVFQALGQVLGLYANLAISWMMAVVADLVINKPLGLSPPGIEFKRAHLYDVNPVGVGAMGIASLLSVLAYLGAFGAEARAFSALIAMLVAFVCAPLIAWLTGGRYYLARSPEPVPEGHARCVICEGVFEADDLARCPAYQGPICSLCCSLDARCHDLCKPDARLSVQWGRFMRRILPEPVWPYLDTGLGHYLLLMVGVAPVLGLVVWLLFYQGLSLLGESAEYFEPALRLAFFKGYMALLLLAGLALWWLVLTHKSRQVAQEESNRQTLLLMREIESHKRTDQELQRAKQAAELANQAKSRYITAISHELRTPLNSILGYAQILDGDDAIPPHRRQAIHVIRRSGDHLLSVIEGTLDIARIEGGKLTLEVRPLAFREFMEQIVEMFRLQASSKGLEFRYEPRGELPAWVRADEKRLRQVLINLLGNAVKYTARGRIVLRLAHRLEMATFEVEDSGQGISADELERIFDPFTRGSSAQGASGAGLGLTISRMFADVMGGELSARSTPGEGSTFRVRLFLPQLRESPAGPEALPQRRITGYGGERRRVLIVDNEREDREFLIQLLEPLGFILAQAGSGAECLALVEDFRPDLIFLDLAMPGMDGWETLRRLRAGPRGGTPVAIISANAYEKGLRSESPDPELGIGARDFILKPVLVPELLDWMGQRLGLTWLDAQSPPQVSAVPGVSPTLQRPPPEALAPLAHQVELGHMKGIHACLDQLAQLDPAYGPFVERIRHHARNFELDAIPPLLDSDSHA